MYLAAAVSDFYIPENELSTHKIQSSDGAFHLILRQVPKMLGNIKQKWAQEAFVVSFKLETDKDLVINKACEAIDKYRVNLVIANELHTRREIVYFVDSSKTVETINKDNENRNIEENIILELIRLHKNYYNSKVIK